jgi:hypothetical protein
MLQAFMYNPASPQDGRFQVRHRQGEVWSADTTEATPAVVVVAGAQHRREVIFTTPTYPDLGVLIDLPGQRILVGAPPFVQSTFVHLTYLDGRYARHYEKVDDRITAMGERVVTWKIHWPGQP